MATRVFTGERFILTTSRAFSDVVAEIDRVIGHPNIADFLRHMKEARSADELERVVGAALGPSGFMEFARFDFGMVLRKDRQPVARNTLRLVLGNPLIMTEMVRVVPDAGSYAPVTVLIDERGTDVQLAYDRMASLLAPYGDAHALEMARNLDAKVERLLHTAAAAPG
jgi:uncharacterized protein (DUF302 family)